MIVKTIPHIRNMFHIPGDPSWFMYSSAFSLPRCFSHNADHPYVVCYRATTRDTLIHVEEITPSTWHAEKHEKLLNNLDPFSPALCVNASINELNGEHVFSPKIYINIKPIKNID